MSHNTMIGQKTKISLHCPEHKQLINFFFSLPLSTRPVWQLKLTLCHANACARVCVCIHVYKCFYVSDTNRLLRFMSRLCVCKNKMEQAPSGLWFTRS